MFRFLIVKLQGNALLQSGLIILLWLASDLVVKILQLPISGGILGLGIVLFLLMTQSIKINNIKKGADLLIKDMLLFFIPAVLALLEHHELLGILGIKILFVIVLSTITVMLVTAAVVDYCYHWRTIHAKPAQ
jgi:holin-like protein